MNNQELTIPPNDQGQPRRDEDGNSTPVTSEVPENAQQQSSPAVGCTDLFGVTENIERTTSSLTQSRKAPVDVEAGWRPQFPKLSDLLAHAERYPNVLRALDKTIRPRLTPLLDQWQKDGRPEIEWLGVFELR